MPLTHDDLVKRHFAAPLLPDGGCEAVRELIAECFELRESLNRATRIAAEWIELGIPDGDAINSRGMIDDIRAHHGLTALEDPLT